MATKTFLITAVMLAMSHAAAFADETPKGTLIEAESITASDSQVMDDAAASGGKYVENAKAWQPLVRVAAPAGEGDAFFLYIKHRNGPLLIKAVVDGKQIEFKQVWDKPAEFQWTRVGPIKRADWGTELLILRGAGDKPIAIDAVVIAKAAAEGQAAADPVLPDGVITTAQGHGLPASQPDASKPAAPVSITIRWDHRAGSVPAAMWGVADHEIRDPKSAGDPGFSAFMQRLNPPLIRVSGADFPKQWLDASQKKWDVDKVRACVEATRPAYGNSLVMLNIAGWPAWMADADGILRAEHEDEYAALCVDLMRLLRDDVKFNVGYWEIFNEHDGGPDKKGRLNDVLRQYIKVVSAMREFEPKAKIGGFAFTWANPKWVKPFIDSGALAASDFVTYHNYGIGAITDSNEKLYSTLPLIEKNAAYLRAAVDEASPGRHVSIYLTEYNVKWVWNPIEPRHANNVGAVFQAAVVRRVALAGIDGAAVWHVKGNAYGIIDGKNAQRLTAPLFEWAPRMLVGDMIEAIASEPDMIEALAVKNGATRSLLLLNKADHAFTINGPLGDWLGFTPTQLRRVTNAGVESSGTVDPTQPFSLPGYSFAILGE